MTTQLDEDNVPVGEVKFPKCTSAFSVTEIISYTQAK